ncbi:GATA transcription factor 27-like isoform X2 [Carex rostrata]
MGKQGPCRHCGVTSTPLWRNGPPEKPVLCNACGSRWRTKGSLANYTPLHVREIIESEDIQPVKPRSVPVPVSKMAQSKHQKEAHRVPKKKPNPKPRTLVESNDSFSGQNFKRASETTDWNSNTRSSSYSGSGVSYSESCAQYDASDFTGSSQSNMWDPLVPSKKRTGVPRPKPTRVEQLTKDLYTILHETPLSSLSAASEEDLVYPSETLNPMDSTDSIEIGSGSILILNSNSKSQSKSKSKLVEEESEASSVPTDVKGPCVTPPNRGERNGAVHLSCMSPDEKGKRSGAPFVEVKPKTRDSLQSEKQSSVRVACDPSLASLDLKEIINFECFSKNLSYDEQRQLHKYLSPADSMQSPAGLRSLFSSSQFIEALNRFQKLVKEGLFNFSLSGVNLEDWKSLRRLLLNNSVKSEWAHSYEQIKEKEQKNGRSLGKMPANGSSSSMASLKRPRNLMNYDSSGASGGIMSSPKWIPYPLPDTNVGTNGLLQPNLSVVGKEHCGLFSSPPDMKAINSPIKCSDDFSNEDLLLDIPCNSSFPEAELLKVIPNEESQSSCGISSYSNKQRMLKF